MGTIDPSNVYSINIHASKVPDTETTKYELPSAITNLQRVIIRIVLGSNATWEPKAKEY